MFYFFNFKTMCEKVYLTVSESEEIGDWRSVHSRKSPPPLETQGFCSVSSA